MFHHISDPNAENPWFVLTTYCLYWTQYSFNFLIYAARSDQYRKAYYDFLKMMCFKLSHVGHPKLSKSTIMLVDRSLMPARLLEFYAQNNDCFNLNNSIRKMNKSTWFDLLENQRNEDIHDFGTTSIGDLGKCSGNYQMILPTISEINVRMHLPRRSAKQCPVLIATSRQFAISRKAERRSSDSRIDNFVEIQNYPINVDNESMDYSKNTKKYFKRQQTHENFSIAIDVSNLFKPYQDNPNTSHRMKRDENHSKEISLQYIRNNLSMGMIASQIDSNSSFNRRYFRQNSL